MVEQPIASLRPLLRAVAIGKWREALKDSMLVHEAADLDRRLNKILSRAEAGTGVSIRDMAGRADLLGFVTRRVGPMQVF